MQFSHSETAPHWTETSGRNGKVKAGAFASLAKEMF